MKKCSAVHENSNIVNTLGNLSEQSLCFFLILYNGIDGSLSKTYFVQMLEKYVKQSCEFEIDMRCNS